MRAGVAAAIALLAAAVPAPAAVRWSAPQRVAAPAGTALVSAGGASAAVAAWDVAAGAVVAQRRGGAWLAAAPAAGLHVLDAAASGHGRTAVLLRGPAGLTVAGAGAPAAVPGTADASQGRVAVDDAGHVVVVWLEPGSGTTLSIRSSVRTGATWSPPEFVDVGAGQTFLHDLVVSRGSTHLLYGVSADGAAAEYLGTRPLAASGWTPVTLAQTGAGIGPAGDLAALSDGRLAALYVLGGRLRIAVGRGSSYARTVLGTGAGVSVGHPALAQDARGDLLAAYARGGRVRTVRRTVRGHAWRVLPSVVLAGAAAPAVARVAGGDVVLVVRARARVLAYRRSSGVGAWRGRAVLAAAGAGGAAVLAPARQPVALWPAVDGVQSRTASRRP